MSDTQPPTTNSPVQRVEAYLAAWNAHDGAAVVDEFAAGGTYVDPFLPGPLAGDNIAGYVTALATAMPDLAFTKEAILATGNRVVLAWLMTGTYTGPLEGLPGPTGATGELRGVDLIDVRPDGILSVVGYFDQITMLRGLGLDVQISEITHAGEVPGSA